MLISHGDHVLYLWHVCVDHIMYMWHSCVDHMIFITTYAYLFLTTQLWYWASPVNLRLRPSQIMLTTHGDHVMYMWHSCVNHMIFIATHAYLFLTAQLRYWTSPVNLRLDPAKPTENEQNLKQFNNVIHVWWTLYIHVYTHVTPCGINRKQTLEKEQHWL